MPKEIKISYDTLYDYYITKEMKMDFSEDRFIQMCGLVYLNRGMK